jgi:hypothetical protein
MIGADQSGEVRIPSRHLGDEVNRNIIQSEIEGGVYLRDLPQDAKIEIETENRCYTLISRDGEVLLCGHPEFCPSPVAVTITGSTWGGRMLKTAFLGRGMHMEFRHPNFQHPIITSRIVELREPSAEGDERRPKLR